MYDLTQGEVLLALWFGSQEVSCSGNWIKKVWNHPSLIDCEKVVNKGFIKDFFGRCIMSDIKKRDYRLYNIDNGPGAAECAILEYASGKEDYLN